jgi:RNA recognition motif-containing protein
MKTLFIRNLPFDASETDLRKAFEAFGRVHRCSIAKNRETGESRGFGFVDMDDEPATKAIGEMNGRMFASRTIVVQESDPKARAGPGAGAPGGARTGSPPPGASTRGPMSGGPRSDTNYSAGGSRDGVGGPAGGVSRPAGAGSSRPGGPPRGAYSSRPAGIPANRNFGPPASPASERNRQYQEKKDRLKPYKRDHFDFRSELDEEEDKAGRRRRSDPSDGAGGEPAGGDPAGGGTAGGDPAVGPGSLD